MEENVGVGQQAFRTVEVHICRICGSTALAGNIRAIHRSGLTHVIKKAGVVDPPVASSLRSTPSKVPRTILIVELAL